MLFLFFLIKNNVMGWGGGFIILSSNTNTYLYLFENSDLHAHIFKTMIRMHLCGFNTCITFKAYFPGDAKKTCVFWELPASQEVWVEVRADAAPCWLTFSFPKVPENGHFKQNHIYIIRDTRPSLLIFKGSTYKFPSRKSHEMVLT